MRQERQCSRKRYPSKHERQLRQVHRMTRERVGAAPQQIVLSDVPLCAIRGLDVVQTHTPEDAAGSNHDWDEPHQVPEARPARRPSSTGRQRNGPWSRTPNDRRQGISKPPGNSGFARVTFFRNCGRAHRSLDRESRVTGGTTPALQPRRHIIASAADGCKRPLALRSPRALARAIIRA
jgi:hypothetical protein